MTGVILISSFLDEALRDADRHTRSVRPPDAKSTNRENLLPGLSASAQAASAGLGHNTQKDYNQSNRYKGWVYAANRPIAYKIAQQPIRVARVLRKKPDPGTLGRPKAVLPASMKHFEGDYGTEVLPGHDLLDAINNPNEIMVRWNMMAVTVTSLQIHGKAFWWVKKREKPAKGEPLWEIWPVPVTWMTPVHSDDKLYTEWIIRAPNTAEVDRVPGDQILYFYYADFRDPTGSISPTDAASDAIRTDQAIQSSQTDSFEQGIKPNYIITVGRHPDVATGTMGQRPVLTADQRAQLIHAIKAHYKGWTRWQEPLIKDGMIENIEKGSMSPDEMDFMDSGQQTKSRILQTYGTNPSIMGQLENANRAASLTAEEQFNKGTVNPIIELMSEVMTAWLVPHFAKKGEILLVYIEPCVTTDQELELKKVTAAFDRGVVDVNFYRHHVLALPPIPGGNVAWIRPELVPVIVRSNDDAPGQTHEDNITVQDWLNRPTPSALDAPPTPPPEQDDNSGSQDPTVPINPAA